MKSYFGSFWIGSDQTMHIRITSGSLSDQTVKEFERVTQPLLDFQPILYLYEVALRNGEALQATLKQIHDAVNTPDITYISTPMRSYETFTEVNRLSMNFIWASRAFIEQTEAYTERTFGRNSAEYCTCRKTTTRLFDENFSYKFLVALRNYMTHRDLPVSHVGLSANRTVSEEMANLESRWVFQVNRDSILTNLKKRKECKKIWPDLERLPEQIDILPLLEEQATWNTEVFQAVFYTKIHDFLTCLNYYQHIRDLIDAREEEILVRWLGDDRPPKKHEVIPEAALRRIMVLTGGAPPSLSLQHTPKTAINC